MPCSVSREEQQYYEEQDEMRKNLQTYGVRSLTTRIAETAACELADALESGEPLGSLSELTQKWVRIHREEDKRRCGEE